MIDPINNFWYLYGFVWGGIAVVAVIELVIVFHLLGKELEKK